LTQEGGTGQVALTFDDGPDLTTTPRVLELLHDANATATFFCIGERAQRHPGIVRQIVQAGHLVENHTFSHPLHFGFLGPRALAREIDRTQRILTELTGRRPELFRAPAGIRSPLLQPLLARRGLRLTSWSRRGFDAVLSDPEEILRRVRQGLTAGDIVLLHDGQAHPFATTDSARPILDVLPRLLDHLKAVGLRGVALHS
jgi:peptidoglycan/xylan/chitin deacetylase (PgdA/CDA1 family)